MHVYASVADFLLTYSLISYNISPSGTHPLEITWKFLLNTMFVVFLYTPLSCQSPSRRYLCDMVYFFFCLGRYNRWWVLAPSKTILQNLFPSSVLSSTVSLQSLSTNASHCPCISSLVFPYLWFLSSLHSVSFLVSLKGSILCMWCIHLIIWALLNLILWACIRFSI